MREPPDLPPWFEDVRPEWIDYNGHLSEGYYVVVFGFATDAVMHRVGMTPDYLVETGTSLYSVEAHVRYLDQVPPGARLEVRSSIIGVTAKLLWLWHEMWSPPEPGGTARLRATEEVLMLHVDSRAGRACPFPDALRTRLEELVVAPPEHASRRIGPL
jgi:acyl-CoA thioester hydrolase